MKFNQYKKNLFFLVLLFPISAWANSNSESVQVILYGVVDLGISSVHVARNKHAKGGAINGNQIQMDSGVQSGSRWGLKGTDFISNDLSVNFVLESGINAQNGTQGQGGRAFGRQATLGLSSKQYGTTDWGRQVNAATRYFGAIDPFALSFGQANMGASFGQANTVRFDNMIMVQSADIQGFQGMVGYSFNVGQSALYAKGPNTKIQPATENFGTSNNVRATTVALRFMADKLIAVVSFDAAFGSSKVVSLSDSAVNIDNPNAPVPKMWALGAKYDLGFMQLSAAVGQGFDGAYIGQAPGNSVSGSGLDTFTKGSGILFESGYDYQSLMLGATIPATAASKVILSWQMMQPKGELSQAVGHATQSILSVAFVYDLSRSTNLYAWGSASNNFQMISTAKSQVVGVGIRHLF